MYVIVLKMDSNSKYERKLPGPYDPLAHEDPRFKDRLTAGGDQVDEYSVFYSDITSHQPKEFVVYKGVRIPCLTIRTEWIKKMKANRGYSRQQFAEMFWQIIEEQSKVDHSSYWSLLAAN